MTQVDRWIAKYKDMMDFMEKSHRNLSRCRIEEHDKLNWQKANRNLLNVGGIKGKKSSEV